MAKLTGGATRRAAEQTATRYGGQYTGYCLCPPREARLREDDARGFARGAYWYVWVAFQDPRLVWC